MEIGTTGDLFASDGGNDHAKIRCEWQVPRYNKNGMVTKKFDLSMRVSDSDHGGHTQVTA